MSWRVKLLCVMMVALFGVFAAAYWRFYVTPKPHGIILFIAPELDLAMLDASARAAGHPGEPLVLMNVESALVYTSHTGGRTPDDADALFSLLATGQVGTPRSVGLSTDGKRLDNLFYAAQRSSRQIGLVTSGSLTHPSCAAFYSHTADARTARVDGTMARQLFDSTGINAILGGSRDDILDIGGRNLLDEAVLSGYRLVESRRALDEVPTWRTRQLIGLFNFPLDPESDGADQQPDLSDLVRLAIQCLQFNLKGYFLVVTHPVFEGSSNTLEHTRDLERALTLARDYAGSSAVIVLYAPSGTGDTITDSTGSVGRGWVVQIRGTLPLQGFVTPATLHELLRSQF